MHGNGGADVGDDGVGVRIERRRGDVGVPGEELVHRSQTGGNE